MTLIEEARSSVRAAQVRAQCAERLAVLCERRARLACGKAPMFLIEANRLRVAAAQQLGEAHRHESEVGRRVHPRALHSVPSP
jgi:hypothetical protein